VRREVCRHAGYFRGNLIMEEHRDFWKGYGTKGPRQRWEKKDGQNPCEMKHTKKEIQMAGRGRRSRVRWGRGVRERGAFNMNIVQKRTRQKTEKNRKSKMKDRDAGRILFVTYNDNDWGLYHSICTRPIRGRRHRKGTWGPSTAKEVPTNQEKKKKIRGVAKLGRWKKHNVHLRERQSPRSY